MIFNRYEKLKLLPDGCPLVNVVEAISLILIAFASTTLLSAVGLAGGVLIVPALILIFRLESRYASGTSIFAIIFGIFSAAFTYFRQRRVDVKLALLFDTLDILGVVAGAYLAVILPSLVTALLMGVFLIFSAWRLWAGGVKHPKNFERRRRRIAIKRRLTDREGNIYEYELGVPELALSQLASILSGVATGLFGIGGGAVDTTVMMLIGVPPHVAVATSVFGMTITKIAGLFSHLALGNVLPEYGVPLAVGATLGGQLGPRISKRLRPLMLRKALSIVVLIVGLRMITLWFG
ncbi:MAG: sulfite exporter TauE/SafE family protein [Thermoproteota archaeon]